MTSILLLLIAPGIYVGALDLRSVFLVVPAGAMIQGERSEEMKIVEEGKKRIAERHFPEAIAAFNRLKQIHPLKPEAYFLSGVAYAESGHLNTAAAELSEALRLGPEQPEHALALANVLTRLGQKRQSIKVLAVFDQSNMLARLSPANLSELMKVYFGLEMTSEALRALDELMRRDPDNPRIDFYRGKIYKLIGNVDLAQEAIEKSLAKAPGNPADYFELGKIYEQRGLMTAAKRAFSEALKQRENDAESLYALGSVCLALNETDEAIKFLSRAETAATGLPKIYYALSQAYLKNGNSEKAAQYLNQQKAEQSTQANRQTELQREEELWLTALVRERLEQGNVPESRALLQQLLELNPNNWEAHRYLAEIDLSSANWQEAYTHLIKLQEINPATFETNRLMACYWFQRRDYTQALSFAQQAKSIQPRDAELRNLLGSVYQELGLMEQALKEYSLAVEYAPHRSDFRGNLERARNLIKR